MWIKKKKFEELEMYKELYFDAIRERKEAEDKYRDLSRNVPAVTETATESIKLVAELTKMLQQVIDITFEDNKGFETVIFQRYGMEPVIFHKGKKIKLDGDQDVSVTYKGGRCKLDVKQTLS